MKIELELDDKIVEGLLEAKKKAPRSASIEDVAKTLLQTALMAGGFLKMGDIVEEAFKSAMGKAGIGSLGGIEEMLDGVKEGTAGVMGVKIGRDGKVETIGGEDLPEGLRDFIGGLGKALADTESSDENDCKCPNCAARRAAEKPKNFS